MTDGFQLLLAHLDIGLRRGEIGFRRSHLCIVNEPGFLASLELGFAFPAALEPDPGLLHIQVDDVVAALADLPEPPPARWANAPRDASRSRAEVTLSPTPVPLPPG